MGAAITLAGEDLIAQKQAAQQPLNVARFILANVPGLNADTPVNRAAGIPPAVQIVHRATIAPEGRGYVNPSQVVYSVMLGSDIGDWDFNWIGLETDDGVLFAVSYVPLQQKRRNNPPLQVGNNLTRNFLVAFDGAMELTGITIDASTWQHDFTARLHGIDKRERLSNRDVYGRVCFFGSAFQLVKVGTTYQLKPGTAYVEGIHLQLSPALTVKPPALPTTAWLDIALKRELSDVVASVSVVWGAGKVDYLDSAGVQHYCVAIADLPSSSVITDRRQVENISGALVTHFAARTGDYEGLRARATTKDDVGLGNLPNAKSDDPLSNSSDVLATTAALNSGMQLAISPLTGMIATFARSTPPQGWLKANGAFVSRTTYAALFAAIGTTFGSGDGSTTFKLPDARGEFIRGWDDARGIDTGRLFGSTQAGQNESHTHTASTASSGAHAHTAAATSSGAHTHSVTGSTASAGEHTHNVRAYESDGTGNNIADSNGGGAARTAGNAALTAGAHTHSISGTAASAGNHSHTITVNTGGGHTHTVSVNASGGNEARPRNIALLACIKF